MVNLFCAAQLVAQTFSNGVRTMKKETYRSADDSRLSRIIFDGFINAYRIEMFEGTFVHVGHTYPDLDRQTYRQDLEQAREIALQYVASEEQAA
jgi:hypothetical protein